jgi:hypothetical protein
MDTKLKQAEKLNKLRNQKALKLNRKDPLDIEGICKISSEGSKTVYLPHLPVMITNVSAWETLQFMQ